MEHIEIYLNRKEVAKRYSMTIHNLNYWLPPENFLDPDVEVGTNPKRRITAGYTEDRVTAFGIECGLLTTHGTPRNPHLPPEHRVIKELPNPAQWRVETRVYLSIHDLADYLGIGVQSLNARKRAGKMIEPRVQVGSTRYGLVHGYTEEDADKAVRRGLFGWRAFGRRHTEPN